MEEKILLKVSLHGMNDRMKKMMASYLENNCNDHAIVVNEDEAQAEIVDIKSGKSFSLLEKRLSQRPSKPIIVLASKKPPSEQVIHVLKPINVLRLSNALNNVKKILDINSTSDVRAPVLSSETNEVTFLIPNVQPQPNKKAADSKKTKGSIKINSKKPFSSRPDKKKVINKKNNSSSIFNASEKSKLNSKYNNRRSSVRYSFQSINMILKKNSVLGHSQNIPILVLNNSSKGAYIHLKKPRRLHGKVMLEIQLDSEQEFTIPARVVRKESNSEYGLYFLKYQHELTESLINSGHKFNF